MKTYIIFILCMTCALSALPSFPGAEGYGAEVTGGRGGRVIIVTNLNDNGAGSLRMALQSTGPRIIVFRVSGVIECQTMNTVNRYIDLDAIHSNFTVAGQTSPGGITLHGTRRAITGSYRENVRNFMFRFLRLRVNATGQGTDCVEFNDASNFIIDHCDFSGGTDGCFDISNGSDYTIQWTTIANSTYAFNDHGGSILANYDADRISIHHNVWAHHESRCGGWINGVTNINFDYVNNICYNGMTYLFAMGAGCTSPIMLNVVGNTFIAGPNTPANKNSYTERVWGQVSLGAARAYESDNLFIGKENPDTNWLAENRIGEYVSTRHNMPAVTTWPQTQAYDTVLNKVGAWPRDAMNVRTMQEIRSRGGTHKNDTAPWIEDGPAPPADSDMDGMPDFWETAMGLNPDDDSDNMTDLDNDGYANVEEYINDLALARLCRDYYNPVYPIPNNWDDYNPSCCTSLSDVEGPEANTQGSALLSAFPNPFNSSVCVSVHICKGGSRPALTYITIYNSNGRLIERSTGADMTWNAAGHPAGVYLVKAVAGNRVMQKKLFLYK